MTQLAEARGVVAVIGLGKIGLPLAIQYVRAGYRVIGCDIDPQVVVGINAGRSHVPEESGLDAAVAEAVSRGALRATTDATEAASAAEVVVIIVPVIVRDRGEVAFESIDMATEAVGRGLRVGALVIYETTLPVGTTARRFRHALERASGLSAEGDFQLAYSPERVSSGQVFRDLATYPKVVGGLDEISTDAALAFYRSVLDAEIVAMASVEDAEFVKLIETTYRDVNIALANEFACFADAHGLDLAAATEAANSQPYSHIHEAGLGVGGHCIPVYPYFLMYGDADGLALARAARRINDDMAEYATDRLETVIGSLAGVSVLILGVAYRGEVREHAFSSAKLLQRALVARGARVYAHDPLYSEAELRDMGYTPLTERATTQISAIVLQAAHRSYERFDFGRFSACRVLLDGRRALAAQAIEAHGIKYLYIGDGRMPAQSEQVASLAAHTRNVRAHWMVRPRRSHSLW